MCSLAMPYNTHFFTLITPQCPGQCTEQGSILQAKLCYFLFCYI